METTHPFWIMIWRDAAIMKRKAWHGCSLAVESARLLAHISVDQRAAEGNARLSACFLLPFSFSLDRNYGMVPLIFWVCLPAHLTLSRKAPLQMRRKVYLCNALHVSQSHQDVMDHSAHLIRRSPCWHHCTLSWVYSSASSNLLVRNYLFQMLLSSITTFQ